MKKHWFSIGMVSLLLIGNLWCYLENERPLSLITNVMIVGIAAINITQGLKEKK